MRNVKRHMRENYYVVGEGILTTGEDGGRTERPTTLAELRKFRFSRLGPKGKPLDELLLAKVAKAMTVAPTEADPVQPVSADPPVPAGFTYLGQFVDHDLTLDNTAAALGEQVTVAELLQGRSPALDLDSVYGRGPADADDDRFYAADKTHLKVGLTAALDGAGTNVNLNGYDLPRATQGSTKAERQRALIPDARNDENLVVAQTHLAFQRFHNRVVDHLADHGVPGAMLFSRTRDLVVKHYQWMLRTDFLPRIVDASIVDDVFTNGRRFVEPAAGQDGPYPSLRFGDTPTMPIEFSVAAYRLGHSMVRAAYDWNRIFNQRRGTLRLLFIFSGTSGNFDPFNPNVNDQESGLFERLPTNWTVDWRRMYDFAGEAGRADLAGPDGFNLAQKIDTLLVDPLAQLPFGAFGGSGIDPASPRLNLAFRNLVRANMVGLASGQQMARFLGIGELKPDEILNGSGGANLGSLTDTEKEQFTKRTPLWFYILREAELNGGRLTGVGGRIVAEVFHRAMEGSRVSIVRDPSWRPNLGPDPDTFRMVDLLLFAFEGRKDLLAPLGDEEPPAPPA
ncbi:myeloperoxidase [Actinoplanes sp. NBRC 103695]|nr:myeloperoxidase [Actinoplanes sp. NBRC 103695]